MCCCLQELISDVKRLTSNNITVKKLMRQVEYRALFGDLRRIALGGEQTGRGVGRGLAWAEPQ